MLKKLWPWICFVYHVSPLCYWLVVPVTYSSFQLFVCILIPFVCCERSRPTNKRNREQKYITKKLATFMTCPALSTKMELFKILCIYFDHKHGTEIVLSNTLRNTKPIFFVMIGILWHKMYDLYYNCYRWSNIYNHQLQK